MTTTDTPTTPAPPPPGEIVAYGAHCFWWDDKTKAVTNPRPPHLPVCPHCHQVLFEIEAERWFEVADNFQVYPDIAELLGDHSYREFIDWCRGKCHPTMAVAAATFRDTQELLEQLADDEVDEQRAQAFEKLLAPSATTIDATDVNALLRAAELQLEQAAHDEDRLGHGSECRTLLALSGIVDHVNRVAQSDSTGYRHEKTAVITDTAIRLEVELDGLGAINGGQGALVDEAGGLLEEVVRRFRVALGGLAAGQMHRDHVDPLKATIAELTRWQEQLAAMVGGEG